MIKNRNIASDAAIDPTKILGGGMGGNRIGRVWHVAPTTWDRYSWLSDRIESGYLWNTVTTALAAADDYDTIYIYPGEYEEAILNVTQRGLRIAGWGTQQGDQPYTTLPSLYANVGVSSTHGVMEVKANNVEICGLGFFQWYAASGLDFGNATTSINIYGTHVHDCVFHMGSTTSAVGISFGSTGVDAPGTLIERCSFLEIVTTGYGVDMDGSAGCLKDCYFYIMTAGTGIIYRPNGSSRLRGRIENNVFQTLDTTNGYGINVANTPTAGELTLCRNSFSGNFADEGHCLTKKAGYIVGGQNYYGSTVIAFS